MKKIFLISIALFSSIGLFSQIEVSISTDKAPLYPTDGDTLSVCRDSMIVFEAEALLAGNPVANALYSWYFDDGSQEEGVGLDSLTHRYSAGGGYRVRVEVSDGAANTGYDIQTVRIAHPPVFEDSNNGLPEDQYGICKGSSSLLTGFAYPYLWEDEPMYAIENVIPIETDENLDYSAAFIFDEFSKDRNFSSGDIDSLCVALEHQNMGEIKVELQCPDGSLMILKDYAPGNNAVMGNPNPDPNSGYGIPFNYCWSAASLNGKMGDFAGDTLPESDYLPFEDFSVLDGCPMNGEWYILIHDNTPENEGYVFSQEIVFAEEALPPIWTFSDTLVGSAALWEGPDNPITQIENISEGGIKATAHATPPVYGNNAYHFKLQNNWNCPADTLIGLPVEAASFTAEPPSGQAKLDVTLTSTTDWAINHIWQPGDETPPLNGDGIEHTYMEKGEYELVYTAEDANGCTDTDTLTVEVSVEPSEVQIPDFFSPDDNGINDILTLTVDGMAKFNFVIYSRWGQKMFETSDEEEAEAGWDGKTNIGAKASPGVYFFIFKGEGKDKKEWEEKGSIQLLR